MVDQDDAVSGPDPLEGPRITFYDEVQAPNPRTDSRSPSSWP